MTNLEDPLLPAPPQPPALGSQEQATKPGFSCGLWGSELKHFTISPTPLSRLLREQSAHGSSPSLLGNDVILI